MSQWADVAITALSECRKCSAEHRHTQTIQSQTCAAAQKRKRLSEIKNKWMMNLCATEIERRSFFAPLAITVAGGFIGDFMSFRMVRKTDENTFMPQSCRVKEAESWRGVERRTLLSGWLSVYLPVLLGAGEHTGRHRETQMFAELLVPFALRCLLRWARQTSRRRQGRRLTCWYLWRSFAEA